MNKLKLVSPCLIGISTKYDGKSKSIPELVNLFENGELIPLCAEQLGGLPTPRTPAGILNGTGQDVLSGKCKVVNKRGEDVTEQFLRGAQEVLAAVERLGIEEAYLKRTSPSCGVGKTWQMRKCAKCYKNNLVNGDGVLTALLKKNGIKVYHENDLPFG